jgi:hypothetical protein
MLNFIQKNAEKKIKQNSTDENSTKQENDPNMDIFKSESFAELLLQNLKGGPPKMNSGLVDIYSSGPFCNENTVIMHWSVI